MVPKEFCGSSTNSTNSIKVTSTSLTQSINQNPTARGLAGVGLFAGGVGVCLYALSTRNKRLAAFLMSVPLSAVLLVCLSLSATDCSVAALVSSSSSTLPVLGIEDPTSFLSLWFEPMRQWPVGVRKIVVGFCAQMGLDSSVTCPLQILSVSKILKTYMLYTLASFIFGAVWLGFLPRSTTALGTRGGVLAAGAFALVVWGLGVSFAVRCVGARL